MVVLRDDDEETGSELNNDSSSSELSKRGKSSPKNELSG